MFYTTVNEPESPETTENRLERYNGYLKPFLGSIVIAVLQPVIIVVASVPTKWLAFSWSTFPRVLMIHRLILDGGN